SSPLSLASSPLFPYTTLFRSAVTFLVIGIMWVNHHKIFSFIGRVDRPVLFINLGLLMTVTVLPWPTSMMAEYLQSGDDRYSAIIDRKSTRLNSSHGSISYAVF